MGPRDPSRTWKIQDYHKTVRGTSSIGWLRASKVSFLVPVFNPALLIPPFLSLPQTPGRNRPAPRPEPPLLSPPAVNLLDLVRRQRLFRDPAGVFTRPLAGKPPSVAPLIYSCGGGGWRTSKSSSDVCAPAAGVDGAGIDTEPPHQQASRAHRRLSAGAAGKTSSAAPRPDETQGRGSSYVAELNLQKRRRIIGSSRNKC